MNEKTDAGWWAIFSSEPSWAGNTLQQNFDAQGD